MFCVHCGKGLPEEARFCYSCGEAQAPSEAPPGERSDLLAQGESAPRVRRRRIALYVGGPLVAVVVVGAVALAVFLAGQTRDERSGTPPETPVPTAEADPIAPAHPGFKARFDCSMMGQPTPLGACLEASSISLVTDGGVREFNLMTLPGGGRPRLSTLTCPSTSRYARPTFQVSLSHSASPFVIFRAEWSSLMRLVPVAPSMLRTRMEDHVLHSLR